MNGDRLILLAMAVAAALFVSFQVSETVERRAAVDRTEMEMALRKVIMEELERRYQPMKEEAPGNAPVTIRVPNHSYGGFISSDIMTFPRERESGAVIYVPSNRMYTLSASYY